MIRHCMRSIASSDGGRYQTHEALQDFMALQKLISYSDGVKGYELFDKALAELRPTTEDDLDRAILSAAKTGVQLIVERSCPDTAARGRASKREDKFLLALERIEAARERSRHRS